MLLLSTTYGTGEFLGEVIMLLDARHNATCCGVLGYALCFFGQIMFLLVQE